MVKNTKKVLEILENIDILYILDIYSAGEKPIKNINSKNLVKKIYKKNKNVFYLKSTINMKKLLKQYFENNNTIIFMGAGSITNNAYDLFN